MLAQQEEVSGGLSLRLAHFAVSERRGRPRGRARRGADADPGATGLPQPAAELQGWGIEADGGSVPGPEVVLYPEPRRLEKSVPA